MVPWNSVRGNSADYFAEGTVSWMLEGSGSKLVTRRALSQSLKP